MAIGFLDICRRRKLLTLLFVVCVAGVVLVLRRRLPYTNQPETSKFEQSSVLSFQNDNAQLPQPIFRVKPGDKVEHANNRLVGVGAMPNNNIDRLPLKETREVKNSNLIDSVADEGVVDKQQQSDSVQTKLTDLVNNLENLDGEYHEVLQLLDPNNLSNVGKEKLVQQLEKEIKQDADIREDSTHKLYVPTSMPLGPPLQLEHNPRQTAVVEAIKHAWKGYREFAWGTDELLPISRSGSSGPFGLGMTIVDCLDTLWLTGLQDEFDEARDWVADSMNIATNVKTVSLFETNIRVLGGLLSAYHLSQDHVFLDKASELALRLLPAFNTTSGVPTRVVNLKHGIKKGPKVRHQSLTVAEAGTLQLEFRDITHATGNPVFKKACDRDMDVLLGQAKGGLVPMMVNPTTGRLQPGTYSVGAGIDSYYEYLIKQWLQSGKTESKFLHTYQQSVQEVKNHLLGHTFHSKLPFIGKSTSPHSIPLPVMDHLSCFYPGMLALGLLNGLHPDQSTLAEGLTHTCYYAYEAMPTGLAPDIFRLITFQGATEDITIRESSSAHFSNILRPETVESLFMLYRLTKDNKYREWGWKIFQAFEKNAKVEGCGYASLKSVLNTDPSRNKDNKMESFFVAETLKYLFLLFTDDDRVFSLDEWVFNTEAHPLRIWNVVE